MGWCLGLPVFLWLVFFSRCLCLRFFLLRAGAFLCQCFCNFCGLVFCLLVFLSAGVCVCWCFCLLVLVFVCWCFCRLVFLWAGVFCAGVFVGSCCSGLVFLLSGVFLCCRFCGLVSYVFLWPGVFVCWFILVRYFSTILERKTI